MACGEWCRRAFGCIWAGLRTAWNWFVVAARYVWSWICCIRCKNKTANPIVPATYLAHIRLKTTNPTTLRGLLPDYEFKWANKKDARDVLGLLGQFNRMHETFIETIRDIGELIAQLMQDPVTERTTRSTLRRRRDNIGDKVTGLKDVHTNLSSALRLVLPAIAEARIHADLAENLLEQLELTERAFKTACGKAQDLSEKIRQSCDETMNFSEIKPKAEDTLHDWEQLKDGIYRRLQKEIGRVPTYGATNN